MQYGLTVDLHPTINPLTESEWQAYFSDQTEPKSIARSLPADGDYLCIVVKSDDEPIMMVPLMLEDVQEQDLIESLVNDAFSIAQDCGNLLGNVFNNLMFGKRAETDPFVGKFVVTAQSIVPGSAIHKIALEQAFRVYTSLTKTMPAVPLCDPAFDASLVRAAAAENLV
ncbi:MAG: hypothetical protein K2Y22_01835 [Candidatus Obscuribacterales bacterium]|nr:hypothetical protein [Candidatus Obscuribacterales bacterium]